MLIALLIICVLVLIVCLYPLRSPSVFVQFFCDENCPKKNIKKTEIVRISVFHI